MDPEALIFGDFLLAHTPDLDEVGQHDFRVQRSSS
jgi:hypothetical protein